MVIKKLRNTNAEKDSYLDTFTIIVISVSLGIISYIAVRGSIDHALQHKLQLSALSQRISTFF